VSLPVTKGRDAWRHLLGVVGEGTGPTCAAGLPAPSRSWVAWVDGSCQGCACEAEPTIGLVVLALVPAVLSGVVNQLGVPSGWAPLGFLTGGKGAQHHCTAPPRSSREEEFGSRLFAEWIELPP